MENTKQIQKKIYSEILSYIKEDYDTYPLPGDYYGINGKYLYFTRKLNQNNPT